MSERSVIITEKNGAYKIQNSVFNNFELLGLLEQIIFDLKNSKEQPAESEGVLKNENAAGQINEQPEFSAQETVESKTVTPPIEKVSERADKKADEPKAERDQKSSTAPSADLRTRIGNAVKAIRDLGGKIENVDLNEMTDDQLQTELEELTTQYKRLKSSKSGK